MKGLKIYRKQKYGKVMEISGVWCCEDAWFRIMKLLEGVVIVEVGSRTIQMKNLWDIRIA